LRSSSRSSASLTKVTHEWISPLVPLAAPASPKLQSAATTNLTLVKAGGVKLTGGFLRNRAAAEKYVKLYDKASAPVPANDTPLITIGLPAGAYIGVGDIMGAYGMKFVNGFAYSITGAYADADTTAVAAADVDVNFVYA
jgi:hypothetical protein